MFQFAKIKRLTRAARLSAAALAFIFPIGVNAADIADLFFYVYSMPGATPIQCAITPDINNVSSWKLKVSTTLDTSPTGEALIPIGKYSKGVPVTCAITEDSAFISGYTQSLFVTWPGYGCFAKNQGSWSQIAILVRGPGCS